MTYHLKINTYSWSRELDLCAVVLFHRIQSLKTKVEQRSYEALPVNEVFETFLCAGFHNFIGYP